MNDLASLRQSRGLCKQRLTKLESFIGKLKPESSSKNEIQTRLDALIKMNEEFNLYSNEILAKDEESNTESNINEILEFEERSMSANSKLLDFRETFESKDSNVKNENPTKQMLEIQTKLLEQLSIKRDDGGSSTMTQLLDTQTKILQQMSDASLTVAKNKFGGKLPPLKFKVFEGKTEEFLSFFQTFDQVIEGHNLNQAAKFWYLMQNLREEPLSLITSLEHDDKPFDVARELLESRYGQKRLLLSNHVRALFHAPAMKEDSSQSLRKLLSETQKQLRYIEHQDISTENWDIVLIHLVTDKLHSTTRGKIEEKMPVNKVPDWKTFHDFLVERCQVLEAIEQSRKPKTSSSTVVKVESKPKFFAHATITDSDHEIDMDDENQSQPDESINTPAVGNTRTPVQKKSAGQKAREIRRFNCIFCRQPHLSHRCEQYLLLEPNWRLEKVSSLKLCINCLKPGHSPDACVSVNCFKCTEKHHTTLHDAKVSTALVAMMTSMIPEDDTMHSINSSMHILLATAKVTIKNANKVFECRALLDSCAQSNFITEEVARKLRLPTKRHPMKIKGIGESSQIAKRSLELNIGSKTSTFEAKLEFVVLPTITENLPSSKINLEGINFPDSVVLADPTFHIPSKIEMLIGAELFYGILGTKKFVISPNLPTFYETKLGYIAAGKFSDAHYENRFSEISLKVSFESLSKQIQQFWVAEEINSPLPILTKEEQACENFFVATTKRDENGTFIVRLPTKISRNQLGASLPKALACLRSLERRLDRDADLRKSYVNFMKEYTTMGHMVEIENSPTDALGVCYIPHLPVIRPDSVTTKMRTVFNASAKTTSSVSLNDTLMVGPSVQNDLWDILMRFRMHRAVFISDISKMYRCVKVHEDDQNLQRILWRDDQSLPVKAYRLTTVTYGTAPASFLATRCLKQLAIDENSKFPKAARVVSDFYMDDIMTGCYSVIELLEIQSQLIDMLKTAGFSLHKWASNHRAIIDAAEEKNPQQIHLIQTDDSVKTLGLQWNTKEDNFTFQVCLSNEPANTKRKILSEISKLFDPLGLVGPIIVAAKLIMRKLWIEKGSWDDAVSSKIMEVWLAYRASLQMLDDLRIHRWIYFNPKDEFELHGFCDASEIAYGAAIYLRTTDSSSVIRSRLMCSKSRIAPIKPMTTPRLELNAALLLSRLIEKLQDAIKVKPSEIHLWTDSTVALSWIRTDAAKLKQYVGNRVEIIEGITKRMFWHHIDGKQNPADLVSRGSDPGKLISNKLWWSGPDWLEENFDYLEDHQIRESEEYLEELRPSTNLVITTQKWNMFDRYSSATQLIRLIAIWRRYLKNLRDIVTAKKENKPIQPKRSLKEYPLSPSDLNDALLTCAKMVQAECFAKEIMDLTQLKSVNGTKSKLKSLVPYLDERGIIRATGRLNKSDLDSSQKHPIIMPPNHKFMIAFARSEHLKHIHAGPTLLLSVLRRQFWPLRGLQLCRRIYHDCWTCFRAAPKPIVQQMGQLPGVRVQKTRPFTNSGIDYAGPITIKSGLTKNATGVKAYIALFVCMATKAAHLELVTKLSTDAFLAALKRFTARRGKPAQLYSDNGRNFVGANRLMSEFFEFLNREQTQNKIVSSLANEGIEWHFNPPYSPHRGGVWEALVRSTKYHLARSVEGHLLTFEETSTLLCDIEAILNSRPIMPLNQETDNFEVLTPGHFLIGNALTEAAEPNLVAKPMNSTSRWRKITELKQRFWTRWLTEYLPSLQNVRNDWRGPPVTLKINDLVVLQLDNQAISSWPLARVIKLHESADKIVRTVEVQTADKKVHRRAVQRLCLLPQEVL